MGVRAKCSRCDYLRTFSDELRGTYYRCPKCREGVIAVPKDGAWSAPSDEAPGVRSAVTKKASDTWSDDAPDEASALARRGRVPTDETPRGAFFGTAPQSDSSSAPRIVLPADTKDTAETTDTNDTDDAAETADTADDESHEIADTEDPDHVSSPAQTVDAPAPERATSGRGKAVKVRRILVECALCSYHVAVPPELFGKTIHCPECRADMMFSESSLEPVKDEIIGRIALEHAERRVLSTVAVPGPIPSPEALKRERRRRIVIVVLLLGVLALGCAAVLVKILGPKGS